MRVIRQSLSPYFIAAFFSLLLSAWQFHMTDVINRDGICYLQSAETVLKAHSLAMHVCNQSAWPFYQVLIAGTSVLTGLSTLISAILLNAFLSLLSVLLFVALINTLTSDRRIQWLGVATILLASHFNSFRMDVIRDHGYWAFYLLSIYCLLNYTTTARWQWLYALLWGAALVIATLFRLEGVIFLLFMPWIVLFLPGKKIIHLLRLNSLLFLVLPIVALLMAMYPLSSLGRMDYLLFELFYGWKATFAHWNHTIALFAGQILSPFSAHAASFILTMGLLDYYVMTLIGTITLPYFVLWGYAFCCRLSPFNKAQSSVIAGYIALNLFLTLFFLLQNLFISHRYLMALALTLMLWVPFALNELIKQWPRRRWPLILAALLIAYSALGGGLFHFGPSKKTVREAGEWLALHAAPTDKIYSNDIVLLYYSKHFNNAFFKNAQEDWQHYDWVAWNALYENKSKITDKPVAIFQHKKAPEIRIYQIKKS